MALTSLDVTRNRLPSLRSELSTRKAAFNSEPISSSDFVVRLYRMMVVRPITLSRIGSI